MKKLSRQSGVIKNFIMLSLRKITIVALALTIGLFQSIEFKLDVQATDSLVNPFASLEQARDARLQQIQDESSGTNTGSSYRTSSISTVDSNQYFVKFKESTSLDLIAKVLTPYVFNMLGGIEQRTFAVSTKDYVGLETSLTGLVEYIEKESEIKIAADTNDSYYSEQWGLTATNIPPVWNYTTGGNEVSVCIIDTGFSNTHPDLQSDIFRQGWDYSSSGEVFNDPVGHGTMVAGIIAADTNNAIGIAGINQSTYILPLKIPMIGEYFDTSKIIEALNDAGDFGCD